MIQVYRCLCNESATIYIEPGSECFGVVMYCTYNYDAGRMQQASLTNRSRLTSVSKLQDEFQEIGKKRVCAAE